MGAQRKRAQDPPPAEVFAALGDPVRLSLVGRLRSREPRSATQLCDGLPLSRQGVEKHLRVLVEAGLAKTEKRGRERLYHLEVERLDLARRYLEGISAGWDRALSRLRDLVDD